MDSQRDRALRTARHVPAGGALHERGEAAAVEQQNDLLASLERARDRGIQRLAPRNRCGVLHTRRAA